MQRPEYIDADLSEMDELLVRTYGCYIGSQEIRLVGMPVLSVNEKIRRSGKIISLGCVNLMFGEEIVADQLFSDAKAEVMQLDQSDEDYHSNSGTQIAYSNIIANILGLRNRPSKLLEARLGMRQYVVDGLEKGLNEYTKMEDNFFQKPEDGRILSGAVGSQKGEVFERLALAHFARRAYPWALAMPALWYSNGNEEDSAGSYDMVVVSGAKSDPSMEICKIQIKTFCFGYCGDEQKIIKSERKFRSEYYDDIIFLSGHCDFGVYKNSQGKWRFPTAELLIREAKGEASEEDSATLDNIAERLFKTVFNANAERRGLKHHE